MAEDTGADLTGASDSDDNGNGETTLAGFQTPEELAAAYESTQAQLESFQKQVTDLERIKGQNSGQISQLKENIANLTGKLEGMQRSAPAGPTLDEIASKVENNELSEAEALRMASQVTLQQAQTEFGKQLQKAVQDLRAESDHEKYVQKFLKDNPGYEEAFKSGKLNPWLDQNITGEEAWVRYQLQTKDAELAELKKKAEDAAKKAEKEGIDKGVQIEKGKTAAGKVLTGKGGGQFAQAAGKYDLTNAEQRRQAGIERLKQMRSG